MWRNHPVMTDTRDVFYFDVDNTLYSKTDGVEPLMKASIHKYIVNELHLDDESAEMLHNRYFKDYGLAIEGLVRFNHVNALEYNRKVDDALPLEEILHENPKLREMLLKIDRKKYKLWLFTNAYKTHAARVVKLLGIEDLFEGCTYCDYGQVPLLCKPKPDMFAKAMKDAGVTDPARCLFVDDSALNIRAATRAGWKTTVYLSEDGGCELRDRPGEYCISNILQLPDVLPQVFDS